MNRTIIAYKDYYKKFFDSLTRDVQEKVLYAMIFLKTQDKIPAKFVKALGEGLFELRVEYQSNIYRIFFCFDKGNLVILFNGFQKKTQKTPKKEMEKARELKKEYDEQKNK